MAEAMQQGRERKGWFRPLWFLAIGVLVMLGANAHLIYVAVSSQPECIAHLKEMTGRPSEYRAAKSAC